MFAPFRLLLIGLSVALLLAGVSTPSRAGLLDGLAAAGDSLTDEYQFMSYSYARNWLEQLATSRSLDFGTLRTTGSGWGSPRNRGYEYNWARAGATSGTLLSEGQHSGLAAQVAAGDVTLAVVAIGANDFGGNYGAIYNGTLAGPALTSFIGNTVANIETALGTIQGGGNVELILGTIPDYGIAPVFRSNPTFSDPAKRQRVTDATAAANLQIRQLAAERSLPVIDLFSAANNLLGGNTLNLGGVTLTYGAGVAPSNYFVHDGVHPHTTVQGIFANLVIEAANRAYGAGIAPLSDQEILLNAGITPPGGGPSYLPISAFVEFNPVPGDATLDGQVTGADYTVWADHFGQSPAAFRDGDFNGDLTVSGADYTIWADNFGQGTGASVPESSGLSLLSMAMASGLSYSVARGFRSSLKTRTAVA